MPRPPAHVLRQFVAVCRKQNTKQPYKAHGQCTDSHADSHADGIGPYVKAHQAPIPLG